MFGIISDSSKINPRYNTVLSWVTTLIKKAQFTGLPTFVNSFLIFSLIPVSFGISFSWLRWEETTVYFLTTINLAIFWLVIGPYFVWIYDEIVLPKFLTRAEKIFPNREKIKDLAHKYNRFFAQKYWLSLVPWMFLSMFLFFYSYDFFNTVGFQGISDPFFWFFMFVWIEFTVLTSIGFTGGFTTLSLLTEVSGLDLKIDPLHHDGLAGLGIVGDFAIETTILISSGSLFIPLGLQLARTELASYCVYFMAGVFSLLIFVSFVYPNVLIHRQAVKQRDKKIRGLKKEYYSLKKQSMESKSVNKNILLQLKRQNAREEFFDYRNVKLYPIRLDLILKLIATTSLPMLSLLLEYMVHTYF